MKLRLLKDALDIDKVVKRLGVEVSEDYEGGSLLVIGVLSGAFVFTADLVRALTVDDVEVAFIKASRYGAETSPSSAEACIAWDVESSLEGRDVLIVEDIVDGGHTATKLIEHLGAKGPASLRLCTLIKRDGASTLRPDYVGFEIKNGFVVGYGLDYRGMLRNLPMLYVVEEE